MHPTAMQNCSRFFDTYSEPFKNRPGVKVVEIGSRNFNGSLREVAPAQFEYIGLDFATGDGVDIVLDSPYSLPFEDGSVDMVVTSSCLEHSEMFWLVFLEVMRILKPDGLFYLNAPSNGDFHRYPVDCWRFYPDSGKALISWAKWNKIDAELLETYTSNQYMDQWNDCVAVFLRDKRFVDTHKARIVDTFQDFRNGQKLGVEELLNPSDRPEDRMRLALIEGIASGRAKV
ncbi:class I SAM-dependent methyltransferase [Pseudoxanthomonas composti]|uniref:Class I SAM-dependent methyltransferase n=2 Tax=Pseudoxanthomonas composti TaxID=2137479 RepID=A0A4Q1JSR8_9GAMM|nr:class I SAM-dependent methyltransferase [Pseudoxanthomonas composti]